MGSVVALVLLCRGSMGRCCEIYHHLWGADEIDALLKEHGLAKAEDTEIPHLTHGPHLAHTFRVSTTTTNEAVELYRNRIITRFFIIAL